MPSALLRESLHFALISACQRFICRVSSGDMTWREALCELMESVDPVAPLEEAVFRNALARLALGTTQASRASSAASLRKVFRAIESIVTRPSSSTKDAYRQWSVKDRSGRATVDPRRLLGVRCVAASKGCATCSGGFRDDRTPGSNNWEVRAAIDHGRR